MVCLKYVLDDFDDKIVNIAQGGGVFYFSRLETSADLIMMMIILVMMMRTMMMMRIMMMMMMMKDDEGCLFGETRKWCSADCCMRSSFWF